MNPQSEVPELVMWCGRKKLYDSKQDANQRISNLNQKNRRVKTNPIRSYYCKSCLGWHVTSKRGPIL